MDCSKCRTSRSPGMVRRADGFTASAGARTQFHHLAEIVHSFVLFSFLPEANSALERKRRLLVVLFFTVLVIGGVVAIQRSWVPVEALSQFGWIVGLGCVATGIGFIILSRSPGYRSRRIYGFGFALFGLSFLMIWQIQLCGCSSGAQAWLRCWWASFVGPNQGESSGQHWPFSDWWGPVSQRQLARRHREPLEALIELDSLAEPSTSAEAPSDPSRSESADGRRQVGQVRIPG
jgi:hypothetical protein